MIYFSYTQCDDNYASQHSAGIKLRDKLFSALGINGNVTVREDGRPCIDANADFSVSHSKHLAICAVLCDFPPTSDEFDTIKLYGKEIGIDAEYIDPNADFNRLFKIAKRYLNAVPASADEFYTLWTRREAFGKLCGEGFFHRSDDCGCTYHIFDIACNYGVYRVTVCVR